MNTILSIDPSGNPAGHTGVVLLEYDDATPVHALASWAVQGGVEPFREWTNSNVYNHLIITIPWGESGWSKASKPADTVICEKFVPRNIPGADYTPLVMEGVIQWVWPDVIWDPASGYKQAVSDDALKRLGLYDFGTDHHADRRSAARHAVRWLRNQKHRPTLRAGWPGE